MSEYQYHEWQTIDRLLTPKEQDAVDRLSSHIDVSSSRAVVTYNWSDFRHDPRQVLLNYFDAYFYLANWGSLRLMFRFPKGLLDEGGISPYCVDEFIDFKTVGEFLPQAHPQPAGRRTIQQLFQRADQLADAEKKRKGRSRPPEAHC